MNDNIYILLWNKLSKWLTPVPLRKKTVAFINAVYAGIDDIYKRFLTYKNLVHYRISITPQTVILRKAINDRFDYGLRRISIAPGLSFDGVPLFLQEENKPVILFKKKLEAYPLILYTQQETAGYAVDFVVYVSVFVKFDMKEMEAFINLFVLQSKIYLIQII